MGKAGMRYKLLLGISVFTIAVISIASVYLTNDELSIQDQELRESIQNEIEQSPKITGVLAQNVCVVLDLECSAEKSFYAILDPNDGYTKFTYSEGDVDYFFRIHGDEMDYKTSGTSYEWVTFKSDLSPDNHAVTLTQSKSYAYEDVCGYPVTDQMRLDTIYKHSTDFTNDGLSYLKLRGGIFTHVEVAQYYQYTYPSLNYWFTLKNGDQVYFQIGACNVDTNNITLGKPSVDYFRLKSDTGEANYEQISAPGFPLVNTVTMQPVLDDENCQRMADYYTRMQSHTMFTSDNVTFDPIWQNQVFPLMDYCMDVGNYEMNTIGEKIQWSFVV